MCICCNIYNCVFFFFNDTATTEIYTLSLHDALPIYAVRFEGGIPAPLLFVEPAEEQVHLVMESTLGMLIVLVAVRSEEHTSELQSRQYLVCRLLLEKKKNIDVYQYIVNIVMLHSC